MNCPQCNNQKTSVRKTWHSYDRTTIYRRRECPECYAQFETAESARVLEIQNAFDDLQIPLARVRYELTRALSELDTVDSVRKLGENLKQI